jgi:hypothetical protein
MRRSNDRLCLNNFDLPFYKISSISVLGSSNVKFPKVFDTLSETDKATTRFAKSVIIVLEKVVAMPQLILFYWQDSHTVPLRIASIEHASGSTSVFLRSR